MSREYKFIMEELYFFFFQIKFVSCGIQYEYDYENILKEIKFTTNHRTKWNHRKAIIFTTKKEINHLLLIRRI